ncbi:MAG: ExbD/TolR family protein [Chitinophagales bacterium]
MPSVKIPRKSTDFDMTPFVDIAFLILSFFMLATKFKPPEAVEITTPNSVSSDILPENDAVLISMDKDNRVFFTIRAEKDQSVMDNIIQYLNTDKNLNLSPAQMANFRKTPSIGVPFSQLGGLLSTPFDQQAKVKQPGIPVLDSATNELVWWLSESKKAFAGSKLLYLIKGDNNATYPTFEAVISALKRNDQFKYDLVTSPEEAPVGTELYKERQGAKKTIK